jgi:Na+/phosphate symporter
MVAMGTSMSDQAWGRESAVYRVTGVLTVIGGWFFTAFMAFTVAALVGGAIFSWGAPAALAALGLAAWIIVHNHRVHRKREVDEREVEVFNLRKITDSRAAIKVSFEHAGIFLAEVRQAVDEGLEGLVREDRSILRVARRRQKKVQLWANILVANIFKVMRLLHLETAENTQRYAQTIGALQEIAECQRDIVIRARKHVANQHTGLLPEQVAELERIRDLLGTLLDDTSAALRDRAQPDRASVEAATAEIRRLVEEFDRRQIRRIQDNTSKTRLSILFYGFLRDATQISEHTAELLRIFEDPLRLNGQADA